MTNPKNKFVYDDEDAEGLIFEIKQPTDADLRTMLLSALNDRPSKSDLKDLAKIVAIHMEEFPDDNEMALALANAAQAGT